MTVERIVASDVQPVVIWHWEHRRVVAMETKIACLPVGKTGWQDWITGTWRSIERDVANNCWIVDLDRAPHSPPTPTCGI